MSSITINVDEEVAKNFQSLPARKRKVFEKLFSTIISSESLSISEVVEKMRSEAEKNGLTQQKLNNLLKEE